MIFISNLKFVISDFPFPFAHVHLQSSVDAPNKKSRDSSRGPFSFPALRLRNQRADLRGVGALNIAGIDRSDDEEVSLPGLHGGIRVRRRRYRSTGQFCVRPAGLRRGIRVVAHDRGRARHPRQCHGVTHGRDSRARERNCVWRVCGIAGDGNFACHAARRRWSKSCRQRRRLPRSQDNPGSAVHIEARAGNGDIGNGDAGISGVRERDRLRAAVWQGDIAEVQGRRTGVEQKRRSAHGERCRIACRTASGVAHGDSERCVVVRSRLCWSRVS
jgi:hypothetical protein